MAHKQGHKGTPKKSLRLLNSETTGRHRSKGHRLVSRAVVKNLCDWISAAAPVEGAQVVVEGGGRCGEARVRQAQDVGVEIALAAWEPQTLWRSCKYGIDLSCVCDESDVDKHTGSLARHVSSLDRPQVESQRHPPAATTAASASEMLTTDM